MGIRLSEVKKDSRSVPVPVGEHEVNVTYRPQSMTAVEDDEFQKMLNDDKYTDAVITFIVDCVANWDLLDDDDNPIMITAEILRQEIPIRFLRDVVKFIMEDMYPKEASASSFVGTS